MLDGSWTRHLGALIIVLPRERTFLTDGGGGEGGKARGEGRGRGRGWLEAKQGLDRF